MTLREAIFAARRDTLETIAEAVDKSADAFIKTGIPPLPPGLTPEQYVATAIKAFAHSLIIGINKAKDQG